jgi:pimeloyl-ACP methyl ester carboxylesterase
MMARQTHHARRLAYDDTGGSGRLVVLLPGAGDLRSEYRFIVDALASAGHRVIAADLPGHGGSPPASEYTVAATADAVVELIEAVDDGPAVIVGTSFAPAAAVWVAADRPDLVDGIVAISPHLHADPSLRGRALGAATHALLRGPWAAAAWAKLYAGWYKSSPPADLPSEIARLRAMLADPAGRRAVRQTLTADRDGVDDKIAHADVRTLVVFGTADDHFPDPTAEAHATSRALGGELLLVDGAGHYPHVEQPIVVADALRSFLERRA